jgi:hypothetical protein
MQATPSLFDRWITRPKRRWVSLLVAAVVLAAPFVVGWLEGSLSWMVESGQWRAILVPPTIITYILLVAPRLATMESRVFTSLRPLVDLDEADLQRLAEETGGMTARSELAAFTFGGLLALLLNGRGVIADFTWLELTILLEAIMLYGLLGVVVYASLAGTRVTSALVRLPMHIDPLDVTSFEAIGRQSLLLALVFMGGVTLSLLFVGFQAAMLLAWEFYVIYVPLTVVPVLVFFLNMVPTHRRLAAARDDELQRVQGLIREECSRMMRQMEQGQEAAPAAQRVTALAAYESRLLQARTWPYNTSMVRTVFVSVLIPGGTMIGRVLSELLRG